VTGLLGLETKMKTSHLFLFAAFVALAIAPLRAWSATTDVSALGEQYVDLAAKGDFAGAAAHHDKTMQTALPQPKLRETWRSVETQAGPFKKRLYTRTAKAGGYDVALVTCEFERAKLDVKVVFNSQAEVSGLFFLPATEVDSSKPPPYAQTNAFREKDFSVGSGQWQLPGTLTMPTSKSALPCPAVVLVHGSGPNDRDETVAASKPFRDLAWGLASKDIAVLRYEKRTKEYGVRYMQGNLKITPREETIDDAVIAANQLRQTEGINPKRVFVLGHSLGATLAPRIGNDSPEIKGLIIMAGATRPIEDLIVEQTKYILSLGGELSAVDQKKVSDLETKVAEIKKLTPADTNSSKMLLNAPPAYWLDLRAHDPVVEAKSLKQPLLILQGGRDYQVTPAQFEDWKKGLESSPNVTFKLYPGLNHLFIAGKGKSTPQEYEKGGYVGEEVVSDIADWVLKTR
jgi:dienelactone hydrolase